jgi:hypothetical protein
MEDYLSYLLERRLHTPAFLRRVRQLKQGVSAPEHTS